MLSGFALGTLPGRNLRHGIRCEGRRSYIALCRCETPGTVLRLTL